MCQIMEDYGDKREKRGIERGRKEAAEQAAREAAEQAAKEAIKQSTRFANKLWNDGMRDLEKISEMS